MGRLRAFPLALLLAVLTAVAGCGGGGGDGTGGAAASGPDPATLAPASAAVYAEALVRPSGDVAQGVLAAARKVFQVQDPAVELQRLLDKALTKRDSSFARDVEPWLGARIGLFVTRPPHSGVAGLAVIAAVRNRNALEAAVARKRANGTLRKGGTYRGVAFDVDRGGSVAGGLVGTWYVAGRMDAFRAAVDTYKGSPSLAASDRFKGAVEPLGDDRLVFAYADPAALLSNVDLSGAAGDAGLSIPAYTSLLRSLRHADPVTLALAARADQISLELHADTGGTPLAGAKDGGLSVGELPGDAWLALATPALGPLIRSLLDATGTHEKAAAQVRKSLGLDLDRDLLAPLGGLAAFARGTNVLDLGGGVELKLRDAAAARTLLTRLRAVAGAATGGIVHSSSGEGFELQIPRSPQPIAVGASGDRVAAGYGRRSTKDLLDPQQRFDTSPAGKAAIATLGVGFTPSFVLLAPPLVELLDSLDQIGIAKLSPALPYLRPYRSLAIGAKRDGDRVTVRVVAALR